MSEENAKVIEEEIVDQGEVVELETEEVSADKEAEAVVEDVSVQVSLPTDISVHVSPPAETFELNEELEPVDPGPSPHPIPPAPPAPTIIGYEVLVTLNVETDPAMGETV